MIKQAIRKMVAPKEVVELENEIVELNKKLVIANQRIASLSKLVSQPPEKQDTQTGSKVFEQMKNQFTK